MKAVFTTCIFIVALFSASRANLRVQKKTKVSNFAGGVGYSIKNKSTCSITNPYLEHFRVKISRYSNPSLDKTEGKCSGEWNVYGTCCPVKELIEHAALDKKAIEAAVESVKNRLPQLRQSLSDLRDFLLHEHFMPNSTVSSVQNAKKAVQELFDLELFENYFDNLLSMSDADLQMFNTSLTTCWQEMVKSRAAAVCDTCSGRSHRFFRNSKGLISQEYCNGIMSHCASTLPPLLEIVIGLYKAESLLQKLAEDSRFGLNTSIGSSIQFNKVNNYYSQLLSNIDIENHLDNYNSTNTTMKTNSLRQLCFHFLHISHTTIIEHIAAVFASDIQSTLTVLPDIQQHVTLNHQQINDNLHNYKKTKGKKEKKEKIISKSKGGGRKILRRLTELKKKWDLKFALQNETQLQIDVQIFVGDVKMLWNYEGNLSNLSNNSKLSVASNIDSSYTSYYGAIGTSPNFGQSPLVLNLTRAFP